MPPILPSTKANSAADFPHPLRIGLIGAGRVGGALALAAHQAGYPIVAIHSRTSAHAQSLCAETGATLASSIAQVAEMATVIFIAVPDDAIRLVDAAGKDVWQQQTLVIHHSGLYSAALLEHAATAGAYTGCLHPLQAIPAAEAGAELLKGAYFGLSGHPASLRFLESFVRDLDGHPLRIPDTAKPLYHAAAVFASNYLVTCFAQAVSLLHELGIPEDVAAQALLPLTQGAVKNLAEPGLPQALTGPLSRGDRGTISMHLQHLAARRPELLKLYQDLGLATLPIAAAQNKLPPDTLEALRKLLAPSCATP